jgi:hypothetical protein
MFKETNWRLGRWLVVAMSPSLLSTRRNKETIVIYGEMYSRPRQSSSLQISLRQLQFKTSPVTFWTTKQMESQESCVSLLKDTPLVISSVNSDRSISAGQGMTKSSFDLLPLLFHCLKYAVLLYCILGNQDVLSVY